MFFYTPNLLSTEVLFFGTSASGAAALLGSVRAGPFSIDDDTIEIYN